MSGDVPENGTARLMNIPAWAKAIAVIGIPGVIALYFVWMNGQILPRLQQEILLNREESHRSQELIQQHLLQQQDSYRLMQRICVNTAKTPAEQQGCFDAR